MIHGRYLACLFISDYIRVWSSLVVWDWTTGDKKVVCEALDVKIEYKIKGLFLLSILLTPAYFPSPFWETRTLPLPQCIGQNP